MERLTVNKSASEMGIYELAHNCCYAQDGKARYRDYEMDMDARDFARNLMNTLTSDELPLENDLFDEEILENLQYDPFADVRGLIALFHRNLLAMADLRERLKEYEDLEEQSFLMKFPCKVGDILYRIDTDEKIENAEIEYLFIDNILICEDGEVLFKYDAYDGVICHLENIITDKPYLDSYRVFLAQAEAEEALKRMKREE